jgi:hypothetical protein
MSASVSSLSSKADIYINVNSDGKIDIIDYTAQDGCPNNVIFNFSIIETNLINLTYFFNDLKISKK